MMTERFEQTVAALAESIMRDRCGMNDAPTVDVQLSVTHFLLATHAQMPDYLRLPLGVLTLVFGFWAVPTAGRPFHLLPHDRRSRQIQVWRTSALGFRRDLIKFYETLAVFGCYSEIYGQDYRHDSDSSGLQANAG